MAIEARYLFNFIRSPFVQRNIEEMQSGSTNQVELNRSEIVATKVPLPPLAEQKRIVAKLDGFLARKHCLGSVSALAPNFVQGWLESSAAEWLEFRAYPVTTSTGCRTGHGS